MPVTRRRLLQAMVATGLLRGWPAFSAEALTFTVGSIPAPQHIQRVISADVARSFEADMMRFASLFWHAPLSEAQFNRIVNAQ